MQRLCNCVAAKVSHTIGAAGIKAVRRKLNSITKRHWYREESINNKVLKDDLWYSDASEDEL
jgi:hypothetical protein